MRILAAGSKTPRAAFACGGQQGFTLLELLVVVSIVAIASAGVALALRDSAQTTTEREAVRLAALLEAGRAQSRMRGVAVHWRSTPTGFRFEGLPPQTLPEQWLSASTAVTAGSHVVLGPDPIIPPQTVVLFSSQQPAFLVRVATDGLQPFSLQNDDKPSAAARPGDTP